MKTDGNDLAFSASDRALENAANGHYDNASRYTNPLGLTKREYFTAMALQAVSTAYTCSDIQQGACVDIADAAVNIADAVINSLNKE